MLLAPCLAARRKAKESFLPVEITGGWVRAEKGIGGRIVLGWFAPGSFDSQDEPFGRTQGEPFDSQGKPFGAQGNLKPRPPKEKNGVE